MIQSIKFRSSRGERNWLARRFEYREPSLLVGPTGSGKTTLVHNVAQMFERRVETIVGSGQLTLGDVVGRWHVGASGSRWQDGPLTRAVREGMVLFFDELEGVSEEVLTPLLSLLDHRRALYLPTRAEVIEAHGDFTFVGAFNPGYGSSRERLTPAFRQRCRFLAFDYLEEEAEVALLVDVTGIERRKAEHLVQCARVSRDRLGGALEEGASTRVLLQAALDVTRGEPLDRVIESNLVLPLSDDPETRSRLRESLALVTSVYNHASSVSPADDDREES